MSRPTVSRPRRGSVTFVALVLVVAGCGVSVEPSVTTTWVTVMKVIDGDTFDAVASGEGITVRLLAVDAPEAGDNGQRSGCLADAATARTTQLLQVRAVMLLSDPGQPRHDRYGRRLAYVDVEGLDVGLVLVREGLARAWRDSDRPALRLPAYEDAEQQARADRQGMWSRC
jgi:micrococcal nuclease